MSSAEFEPAIQCTSAQGPRLSPRGHWIGIVITLGRKSSNCHNNNSNNNYQHLRLPESSSTLYTLQKSVTTRQNVTDC
jgi:hypothetical protein